MLLKVQNIKYVSSRQTQNWYLFRLEIRSLLYELHNDIIT